MRELNEVVQPLYSVVGDATGSGSPARLPGGRLGCRPQAVTLGGQLGLVGVQAISSAHMRANSCSGFPHHTRCRLSHPGAFTVVDRVPGALHHPDRQRRVTGTALGSAAH